MNEFPILLYTTPEGGVKVNAVLKDETLWLTQGAMAELFGVQSQAITKHLKNRGFRHKCGSLCGVTMAL